MNLSRFRPAAPLAAGPRAVRWFWRLALAAAVAGAAGPPLLRPLIRARQRATPESRIHSAVEAARKASGEAARRAAERALALPRVGRFEGRGESALCLEFADLSAGLAAQGLDDLAAEAALRAIREYHMENRPLEYPEAWVRLAIAHRKTAFSAFLESGRILTAHAPEAAAPLAEAFRAEKPDLAARLTHFFRTQSFRDLARPSLVLGASAPPLAADEPPALTLAIDSLRAWAMMAASAPYAEETAEEVAARNPSRPEAFNIAGSYQYGSRASAWAEWLASKGAALTDFSGLKPAATPWLPATSITRPGRFKLPGAASLFVSGAAEIEFEAPGGARSLYLLASGSGVMGVFPIALVSIDGGPARPLYVDSEAPKLFPLASGLAPGRHSIRLEYLNDFQLTLDGRKQDRNLHLLRLAVFE